MCIVQTYTTTLGLYQALLYCSSSIPICYRSLSSYRGAYVCTYLSLVQFEGSELHCVVCDCSSDKCTIQGNTYSTTKSGSAGFKTTYTLTILSVCVEYCLDPDAFSNPIYKTLRNGLRRRFTFCVHHFIICEISQRSLRLRTVFNCL